MGSAHYNERVASSKPMSPRRRFGFIDLNIFKQLIQAKKAMAQKEEVIVVVVVVVVVVVEEEEVIVVVVVVVVVEEEEEA
mgnify:FL=1